MRSGSRRVLAAGLVIITAGCLSAAPAWASPAFAQGAQGTRVVAPHRTPRHCPRHHTSPCRGRYATQNVTGSSGNLTVTFTASQSGSTVTFDIASSDTQAYGALGAEILSFGNGDSQGFGMPQYCLADPIAESNDQQVSYTYPQAGTFSASVTVGANCTPDHLTLTLPVTIN
jgi:hypothetical protein